FFCVLAPEGMNAIVFGERRGRNQKTTACSEGNLIRSVFSLIYCDNIMIILLYTVITGDIILSSLTSSQRQYQNKPRPSDLSPFSLQKLFHSFLPEPKHRK
ncbi:MAG: hypothetical protein ACLS67_08605, partial [Anaerobutyricum soehngenii]